MSKEVQYEYDYYNHDGPENEDLLGTFEVSSEVVIEEPYSTGEGRGDLSFRVVTFYTAKLLYLHFGEAKISRELATRMYGSKAVSGAEEWVEEQSYYDS